MHSESILFFSPYVCIYLGPSDQPNIEHSAAAINEVITFRAGPEVPNTISVTFHLTDDDVALEEVERYFASLSVEDSASGVLIVEPEMTQINVLDDDGREKYIFP